MQQDERAALGGDTRAELLEHHQARVVGPLEATQVEEDPSMTDLVQSVDGAGQQVGALDRQTPTRLDRARATVDDLGEQTCFAGHGTASRYVAPSPGRGIVEHRISVTALLCNQVGRIVAVS